MLISIAEVENLKGKTVLLRASLNVPISNGVVTDDLRIQKVLPTIALLKKRGARIILISHLSEGSEGTLHPVCEYLQKSMSVSFIEDIFSSEGMLVLCNMKNGEIVLCENIRRYPGEEANDPIFAENLSRLADYYVNDDFTVAHREHASIVRLPELLPSYMGLQFAEEFEHLSKALHPPQPALLIMGGAKPSTKIPLIQKFTAEMGTIFIGGISANVLLQAKGYEIGLSVTEDNIFIGDLLKVQNVILPSDVLAKTSDNKLVVKQVSEIGPTDTIVDGGPGMVQTLCEAIRKSKFVLWNGPLGDYEKGFYDATLAVAKALAESDVYCVVGGGDTIAALRDHGLHEKFTFLSTAGAAMLEFLMNGTLPGIEALKKGI